MSGTASNSIQRVIAFKGGIKKPPSFLSIFVLIRDPHRPCRKVLLMEDDDEEELS